MDVQAWTLTIVGLTGFEGGTLKDIADHHINVHSENYGAVEDLHLSVGHMVIQRLHALVERSVADTGASSRGEFAPRGLLGW